MRPLLRIFAFSFGFGLKSVKGSLNHELVWFFFLEVIDKYKSKIEGLEKDVKAILKQESEEKEVTKKFANDCYCVFTNSWIGDVVLVAKLTKLMKPPKHIGESLIVLRQKSESNRRSSD